MVHRGVQYKYMILVDRCVYTTLKIVSLVSFVYIYLTFLPLNSSKDNCNRKGHPGQEISFVSDAY